MGSFGANYGANYQLEEVVVSFVDVGISDLGDFIVMHTDDFGEFIVRADS